MDISVLPNNNHPEKFLQLDVGILDATHGMFQREQTTQHGRKIPPYSEGSPVVFVDRYLEKHITPVTLKYNIKRNPLYMDIKSIDTADNERFKPSWTIKEYDTQTIHGNLTDYLKDTKTPKELDFWLEDLYTPGFDSLLKRKEAEHKRKKLSKISREFDMAFHGTMVVLFGANGGCVEGSHQMKQGSSAQKTTGLELQLTRSNA
ncbi:major intrinsically disordered NOTCH2-binding receptor 1-like [Gambusia affinis]|uniref:major intrinsically disordered NOTCH2-binding receptor 1-like n=1 Tax=Gambusia affinis TaxID=33528 RepID=UPI001CDD7BE2|nr:major intrinsically disordered NOTCH2-binding receptor 1-like [Gambusia affinis]